MAQEDWYLTKTILFWSLLMAHLEFYGTENFLLNHRLAKVFCSNHSWCIQSDQHSISAGRTTLEESDYLWSSASEILTGHLFLKTCTCIVHPQTVTWTTKSNWLYIFGKETLSNAAWAKFFHTNMSQTCRKQITLFFCWAVKKWVTTKTKQTNQTKKTSKLCRKPLILFMSDLQLSI